MMPRYRLLYQFLGKKEVSYAAHLTNSRCSATVSAAIDDTTLSEAKPYEELPSALSFPIIGTAWLFLPVIGRFSIQNINEALEYRRKQLGDIYREKLGPLNMVVSFSADDLQTMYKYEGPYPMRTELESVKRYRQSRKDWYQTLGLVAADGEEWWELRKKTQKHLMKPKVIQAFLNPMQDVARDLTHKISLIKDSNQEVPNLLEELCKWALESVALVGLDVRLRCLDINLPPDSDGMKMITSVQTMFDTISRLERLSGRIQFWKLFPTPTWRKFVKASDTFTEIASRHIKRSMEKLKNAADENEDPTMLQSLLLEKGMSPSDAMVMVSDMMAAGIDATSHTVGFFLYNMAKNPEKQEKLYQELKSVLPNKEDRITTPVFNELKYLKACIKESQRLNPAVGGHARILDRDVVFSGYRVPAKTLLLIGIQSMYKDEKYFSKPNKYLPERWLTKDEKFHPFAYLPFSFGVRSCVGRRLAELEIIALTSELIRNFKIEYHHEDINMITRMTNIPDKPMRFNFIDR